MKEEHFDRFFDLDIDENELNLPSICALLAKRRELLNFEFNNDFSPLQLLLLICKELQKSNIYPKDWSDLLVLRNK